MPEVIQTESPPDPAMSCDWLAQHAVGWQFGEQGVIEAIIMVLEPDIPEEHRWAVEFGAGDGATLPLTLDPIIRRMGWRSLLIEADEHQCDVLRLRVPESSTIVNGWVTLDESTCIDAHMECAGCPQTPAVMVVDVNSIDYYIVAKMKATPYILCVEHMDTENPQYPQGPFVPRLEDAGQILPGGYQLQGNTHALDETIVKSGYTLVYRTRVNSIYVRNDAVGRVARKPDGKVRLNLGAGGHNHPGYTPLDIKDGTDVRKLPYPDNSVEEVYASHLLEHFAHPERDRVVEEWARVLKPNGVLRIAVPDQKKLAKEMIESDESGNFGHAEAIMYGGHSDPNDIHHTAYTERVLRERMNAAGIGFVSRFQPFIRDDCSNNPMSLNLQGQKRWWPKVENPVITLVLSQPRLAFTEHELRLIELAKELKINVQPCTGAFWDRDITQATIDALELTNPHFVLYSDYDSVFEVEDVKKLLDKINNDPQMAVIGSVQMSRHNDEPLVFEKGVDYSGEVCRVTFQHFGLTLIRKEVFQELEQPWFWSIPGRDAKGNWDWASWRRSDADITFWRKLKALGMKVCQHNGVCIGHICQCIKYPRDRGRGVQYHPIENYRKIGKPADAVFNADLYRKKTETK